MKLISKIALTTCFALIAMGTLQAQQSIGAGTYTQNFDNIGNGLPDGFSLAIDATANTIGTPGATFATAATSWGASTGNFRNVANADAGEMASTADQENDLNRSLGLRQTGSFGDAGAAFNFNFSSSLAAVTSISIDLQMLSVQGHSTSFAIQYGIGITPTNFTTLATYTDPGTFGLTNFTFTPANFGVNLDNQNSVYFRVVALEPSTGSGSRDTVGIDNLMVTATAIPEPSVYMLLGVGLLLCGQRFLRGRKSKPNT
ncbi:MAG: hypothetical protein ACRD5Z_07360 [Bryobacteraceae bacterium]